MESVAAGRAVAWWGLILGRLVRNVEGLFAVVVVLAAEERLVLLRAEVRVDTEVLGSGVVAAEGCGMPVRAVQISAIGGEASVHGTVKRGLSQRLWMLGSS